MSTNENTPVEHEISDDLDAFSSEFFGQNTDVKEPASSEEDTDAEDGASDASDENNDTHADAEDETEDNSEQASEEDADSNEEDEEEEPAPKPKKNRFQERIDELTNARREAERKAAALEERLAKLESKQEDPVETPIQEIVGPQPDDKNEDGTERYPLGEFDPGYIRDLTKFTLEQEREQMLARDKEAKARQQQEAQREELQQAWKEKLGPAQERYPDFHEKGENLVETFEGIDQAYGEYLTATLMSMEYGPDVLYYLANNVDEAEKIVQSGPTRATIALGRLEAKFAFADEEKQKARPKVSKAPTPPPHLNKGSSPARVEIPDDTDDLDAFSKKFFNKKRRS